MQFIVKTLSSTVLGMLGGWLGNYAGLETALFSGLFFSIAGWYGAKYLWNKYMD